MRAAKITDRGGEDLRHGRVSALAGCEIMKGSLSSGSVKRSKRAISHALYRRSRAILLAYSVAYGTCGLMRVELP